MALAEGSDDHEKAARGKSDGGLTGPLQGSLGGDDSPAVQVAGEEETLGGSGEDASAALGGVGWALVEVDVPGVARIQPGFDMGKAAFAEFHVGKQAAEEVARGGRIVGQEGGVGLMAEAQVVIPPDAHDGRLVQQAAGCCKLLAGVKHVAEKDDLVDLFPFQELQGLGESGDIFVDVGEQAKFHGR